MLWLWDGGTAMSGDPLNWRADIAVDEAHLTVLAKAKGPRLHPICGIREFLARAQGG